MAIQCDCDFALCFVPHWPVVLDSAKGRLILHFQTAPAKLLSAFLARWLRPTRWHARLNLALQDGRELLGNVFPDILGTARAADVDEPILVTSARLTQPFSL